MLAEFLLISEINSEKAKNGLSFEEMFLIIRLLLKQ